MNHSFFLDQSKFQIKLIHTNSSGENKFNALAYRDVNRKNPKYRRNKKKLFSFKTNLYLINRGQNIKTMWTDFITLKHLFLIENPPHSVSGAPGSCRFCVSENERGTYNQYIINSL